MLKIGKQETKARKRPKDDQDVDPYQAHEHLHDQDEEKRRVRLHQRLDDIVLHQERRDHKQDQLGKKFPDRAKESRNDEIDQPIIDVDQLGEQRAIGKKHKEKEKESRNEIFYLGSLPCVKGRAGNENISLIDD